MILWLMIIIGLAVAFLGLKKGFFFMFAALFHMMFAIFIAVLTTPMLLAMSPGFESSGYYAAGCILILFVLIFGVLHGFGWYFFLRDREDFFPKMLEKAGGAVFGFLCGYTFCSVLLLALCIMPCSRGQIDWLCTRENLQKLSTPGVFNVCNFLGWYSLECFDGNVERAVDQLLTLNDPKEEVVIPVLSPKQIMTGNSQTVSTEKTPTDAPAPAVEPSTPDNISVNDDPAGGI